MHQHRLALALPAAALLLLTGNLARADEASFTLTLKNHKFSPAEITIPANNTVHFLVTNQDPTPAEFESDDFRAEKLLPSGRQILVVIPPLKPGTYEFHDEYNEDASKSRLVVK